MADYISALNGQQMDAALTEVALYNPEAWAVGQRNGIPVTSADETYHNNAKYYAQVAQSAIPGTYTAAVRWDIAQGLAGESQEQARANISAGASNRNLLDNPWWGSGEVVNQRGITGTPANQAYCIDRWIYSTGSGSNAISLGANGITFTPISGQYMWMNQHMAMASWLTGKTFTGSIMLADGTIYSGTVTVTTGNDYMYFNDTVGFRLYFDTSNNVVLRVGTTKTVRALKVELGSYSTLANDVPPDYADELRKCMYYFQRIQQKNSYTLCVGFGEAMNSTTNIRITIPTAVPMRHQASAMSAVPTGTGTMYIIGNGQSLPVTAVAGLGVTGNAVTVNVTVSTAGAYNHIYGLRFTNNSTYLDLSADL